MDGFLVKPLDRERLAAALRMPGKRRSRLAHFNLRQARASAARADRDGLMNDLAQ
jgi:hypothetical protein